MRTEKCISVNVTHFKKLLNLKNALCNLGMLPQRITLPLVCVSMTLHDVIVPRVMFSVLRTYSKVVGIYSACFSMDTSK